MRTPKTDLLLAWSRRIEEIEISDYSICKYCSRNNLPRWQYYYWRKKIKRAALPIEGPRPSDGDFLELTFSSARSGVSSGLAVSFGDGIKIIPERGFSDAEFIRVAKLLRSLGQC